MKHLTLYTHAYTNLCFWPCCHSVLLQQFHQNNLNLHQGKPRPDAVPWPITEGQVSEG